ncbi:aspartate kinase [Collinsella provencensis]|uniref:aspartate kinase n=1 Tax=Collinsella provencensis TaxID=1937461 RepID=UPI000C815606|nr:aspartate kinase [Collinsella provencensis]
MIKIAKFGGSSVADAEHFKKIKAIVDADPGRRFVVVSACGRRFSGDTKVTDLLYLVDAHVNYHVSCDDLLEDIGQRYFDIADDLGLTYPIREEFAKFAEGARAGKFTTEYLVSRGEYFTARLMAEYLGLPFIDAADMVAFHHDGTLSMSRTTELVKKNAREGGFLMPGFYGATKEGRIKLLDRGGGDISGSILAQCLGADLYENWTDVSGFLSADPRIVPSAQPIPRITYEELRELSYMGASVLHEEAVFPVREAGIPLVIKNTNAPEDPGTIISETAKEGESEPIITGIAGKRGFIAIAVSRDRTKSRIGFMRRALSVFERYGVSVEHMPTGVDQFAAVVQASDVKDSLWSLIADIKEEVEPLEIEVVENLALIATVGRNLRGRPGVSGHLFGKLGEAGVSVRMITQGCDEINIICGVEEKDFDLAIATIYDAFCEKDGTIVRTDELNPVSAPL